MKQSKFRQYLPLISLFAGATGLLLEWALYRFGMDDRGMLIPGFLPGTALSVLSVAVLGLCLFGAGEGTGIPASGEAHKAATVLAAVGIGLLSYGAWAARDVFSMVAALVGAVAVVLVLLSALVEGLHLPGTVGASVFFAMHCVVRYRQSNADPQLSDYIFPMLAEVALMMAFYHAAAKSQGENKPKVRGFWHCAGIYLCCVAVYRGGPGFLFLLPWLMIL